MDNVVYSYAARASCTHPALNLKEGDIVSVTIEKDPDPTPPHDAEPILFEFPPELGFGDNETIERIRQHSPDVAKRWVAVPIICVVGEYNILRLEEEWYMNKGYTVIKGTAYVDPDEAPIWKWVEDYVGEQLQYYEYFVNGNVYGFSIYKMNEQDPTKADPVYFDYGYCCTPDQLVEIIECDWNIERDRVDKRRTHAVLYYRTDIDC